MFKKGFLQKAKAPARSGQASTAGPSAPAGAKSQQARPSSTSARAPSSSSARDTVAALAERLSAIKPMSSPYGGLPPELLIHVVEELVELGVPQAQHDIASLRLASKLLCFIATPHFHKAIQIYDGYRMLDMIEQVQDRPELCATTRAVWWDNSQRHGEPVETSRPHLVHFPNLAEMGYCYDMNHVSPSIPHGVHYALREIGPWCSSVSVVAPDGYLHGVQSTPSINLASSASREEIEKHWMDPANRKRAMWGVHVVVPFLDEEGVAPHWEISRTVTHLTITLFEHPSHVNMQQFATIRNCLDRRRMPLLEHLWVRLVSFGKRPNGLPTAEDRPCFMRFPTEQDREKIAYRDMDDWQTRQGEMQYMVDQLNDRRLRLEAIELPGMQSQTRYEDVRKFTRQQWQERVNGGPGPWKDPLTQSAQSAAP